MADTEGTGGAASRGTAGGEKVIIKKYANRRLYNTASSSYVTLEHLSGMVKEGVDFVVYDAKTNEDITRTVLTQIIVEEESQGQSLLPIPFLRQLIGFYGNSMQAFVPSYLELSLASFTQQQERLRTQMGGLPTGPIAAYEDLTRQNLQLFDRAMKMFSPFAFAPGGARAEDAAGTPGMAQPRAEPGSDDALTALRKQMSEMQTQLDRLGKG